MQGIIDHGKVEDYLQQVHDIDYSDIDADGPLREMIGKCASKDRRFVFTASTKEHGRAHGSMHTRACKQALISLPVWHGEQRPAVLPKFWRLLRPTTCLPSLWIRARASWRRSTAPHPLLLQWMPQECLQMCARGGRAHVFCLTIL